MPETSIERYAIRARRALRNVLARNDSRKMEVEILKGFGYHEKDLDKLGDLILDDLCKRVVAGDGQKEKLPGLDATLPKEDDDV